ncbi:MAG: LemA family protein [Candidatus Micrarchaeaceae archaeon]
MEILLGILLDLGIAVLVIALILIAAVALIFNSLIVKRNRVQNAMAQIDVQLKRRYDLIPNLVDAVKGYMKYEKGVLTTVTQLRASIVSGSMQDRAAANNMVSQALKSIFAVAENYPDLKASANFQNLQSQLQDTEDKIAFVRTSYNDYVLDYNNAIQEVPGVFFANAFGFKKMDFFQEPDGQAKEPVKVNFDDVNQPASGQDQAGAKSSKKGKGSAKSSA